MNNQLSFHSLRIRRLRESCNLTWDQLAKLFGVSRGMVVSWANYSARMRYWHLARLSQLELTCYQLPAKNPKIRRAMLFDGSHGLSVYDQLIANRGQPKQVLEYLIHEIPSLDEIHEELK